jgi:hypothetical protein
VVRQALVDRMRPLERTLRDLWHLARHPCSALKDADASADILRDLCEGGIVVSTAFPTAAQTARVRAVPAPGLAADAEAKAVASRALDTILAEANDRGAAAGAADRIALRTVLQADGHVALLIDRGLADGDQQVLRALAQVHAGAVRDALGPLVRAQGIALALRASVRVAAPAFGVVGGAAAHWISDVIAALISGVVTAAVAGGILICARWALEAYVRRKVRKVLQG